jgi:hypothetical protein
MIFVVGELHASVSQRRPTELPGRAPAKPRVLTGLVRCGLCGSSYQLETSGKSLDGATYSYSYYNCRKTLRAGKKACAGFRVRVEDLDGARVFSHYSGLVLPKRSISRTWKDASVPTRAPTEPEPSRPPRRDRARIRAEVFLATMGAEGLTRPGLAKKLGVSRAWVTKCLGHLRRQ